MWLKFGIARWSPLLALPLLLSSAADAGEWRGSIRLATDYAYRGYSKSRGNPVVQGRIDYEHESGGFAGFGISNVSFDDKGAASRANVEMNPYAGWSWRFSDDWRGDITASYYTYDGDVFFQTVDFAEFSFAAHYKDMLSARISFAPDAFRQRANTLNYELQWRHDVLDNVRVSLGLGFHQAGRLFHQDYFHWNAGITWFPTRIFPSTSVTSIQPWSRSRRNRLRSTPHYRISANVLFNGRLLSANFGPLSSICWRADKLLDQCVQKISS